LESLGGGFHELSQMREEFKSARRAVDRALALAPELALAHVVRGNLLQESDFDWPGAEAEFHRAIELAPNDGEVKAGYGYQLATTGKLEPAIDLTRQALATEPLRADFYDLLAMYLTDLDRLDEAERAIHQAIELQPTGSLSHKLLAVIKVQRGDAKGALSAAQQEPPGYLRDVALALAYQIGGDRAAADLALKNLIDSAANITPYQIASVYALRNDAEATFRWLDRAWDQRDNGVAHLFLNPLFRHVKDDPRFAAFCRKLGLPTPAEVVAKQSADQAGQTGK
jgi:Flp pilus assembly protein TadD